MADVPRSVLWKYLPRWCEAHYTAKEPRSEAVSDPTPIKKLDYLVTGTGRSGTVSLAIALSSAGICCSHERFFRGESILATLGLLESGGEGNSHCSGRSGLSDWGARTVAESSYLAAPYLAAPFLAGTTVVHAVRDPWKVLPSFLNDIQFFRAEPIHAHERFIYSVFPELERLESPVDRAAYYYIQWNLMIEWLGARRPPTRYVRHRVEDGPEALLRGLGAPEVNGASLPARAANSFKDWDRHMRPAPARPISTAEMLQTKYLDELCLLAERYGYEHLPSFAADESEHELMLEKKAPRIVPPPFLAESGYRGFNIVVWQEAFYGIDQALGHTDLQATSDLVLDELIELGKCVRGKSLKETKAKVDRCRLAREMTHA